MTTMDMIIALLNLPGQVPQETPDEQQRRFLESGRKSSAIDKVNRWSSSPLAIENWHIAPDKFAERLKALVDAPYKLAQSDYPWCTYASVMMCLLRRSPELVVDYALKLYDTGTIRLGGINDEVSSDLRDFDVARYLNRELPDKPPHGAKPYSQPVDFMLMAGLCSSKMNGILGDFDGPIGDSKATPPMNTDDTMDMMLKSGIYRSVTTTEIKLTDTDAVVQALIAPSSEQDILLVADMSHFIDCLELMPREVIPGQHIVPVVKNDGAMLSIWSWGDKNIKTEAIVDGEVGTLKLDLLIGGYTMGIKIAELKKPYTSCYVITAILR